MTVLQTLTLAEVKAKAREYYAAGKLTAQHPNRTKRMCVNKGADGHRCAVAAAFNDELLDKSPMGSIGECVNLGKVAVDYDELILIQCIQWAHDEWAIASAEGYCRQGSAHDDFLKLINAD